MPMCTRVTTLGCSACLPQAKLRGLHLRPRAHDGVGVEVDPRSEEATDAPEGVVKPREVCGRVHPQQLLGRRVGFRLVDAQLCGRVQDVW